jgi:hypothetical protein
MGDWGRPIRDRPCVRLFPFWEKPAFISVDSLFVRTARHTIVMYERCHSPQVPVLLFLTQRRRRFGQPSLFGLLLLTLVFCALSAAADCIPISEARQHIGEDQCVSGKVFRVKHAGRGITLFDFCQDSMVCPFTVVVFPHDLKRIGDVSQLQNKVIEVHGPVKEYDGRAEIVLQQLRQLGGEGLTIPRLPKNYDVENKGHYSAGSFSLPKPAYATYKRKQPAKIPINVPPDSDSIENPGPPQ